MSSSTSYNLGHSLMLPSKKPSSAAFSFGNANPPSTSPTNPRPLPDFGFKKAENPSSAAFSFGNANQPSVLANRSTLREDLNAVAKVLERWSNYPYLVFQAADSEKINAKELWGCANAIVEAKNKIVLAFVEGIKADK
jgi:hypothetical protein